MSEEGLSRAKIQGNGKKMLMQLFTVLRTARIHDPTNNALLIASENLKDTINGVWAALGEVRLTFVDDLVYLNDIRLRIEGTLREHAETLAEEFDRRGLGGLSFAKPVDTSALREFLVLFSRSVDTDEEAAALRDALSQMKDLALELIGPRALADDDATDVKIDRKTFALQTYSKTVIAGRECLIALREGKDPMTTKLHLLRIVQDLVDIATERVNLLLRLSAIKEAVAYAHSHAANTCVLGIVMGKALAFERVKLVDLGLSCFFAGLPIALMSEEQKGGTKKLSNEERQDLRLEALTSASRLLGGARLHEGALVRLIVACEHLWDYDSPLGGRGAGSQHIFSRIAAVASAYDSLTTVRPWRDGYPQDEALRIISDAAGTRFDPVVVKILVNLLGVYPLGAVVSLDSGEIACVYHNSNDPELYAMPWVKIIQTADGEAVQRTMIRNLAEHEGAGGQIVGTTQAPEDLKLALFD